jgi:integrase
MGLYKQKRSKNYWMDKSIRGQRFKKPTGTANKALAQKIFAQWSLMIDEDQWFERLPGEGKTFKELGERYLIEYSLVHKKESTHRRDKSIFQNLNNYFGGMILTDITRKHVVEYKTIRRNKVSPRTVNYELTVMSHAFTIAIREFEWLEKNPVSLVSKERVNNLKDRFLSLEEEVNLLAVSPLWLKELIVFAINCGMREGEILSLEWGQVDLFNKTLSIQEQKNGKKDLLPLNAGSMEVLLSRSRVRSLKTNLVFFSGAETKIDARNLLRALYSACEKAEIEGVDFHTLRHTFCSRLLQRGVPIYDVMKLGRWKDMSMIRRYGHLNSESLRPGIETLDHGRPTFVHSAPLENSEKYGELVTA